MKKRLIALLTMMCVAVSLAACGGSATQEETTSDTTAETTTSSDASDSDLPSLEESFAADGEEVQSMLDAMQAQYEDQGISVKLYAEGDEMHYDFRHRSIRNILLRTCKNSKRQRFQRCCNRSTDILRWRRQRTVQPVLLLR